MQLEVRKYLNDILNCIENIENYMHGQEDINSYSNNMMLQQAVERNLEIIGEAMNNALKIDNQIKITDARRMVDTRNKLIHSYDQIQLDLVWKIIKIHIPVLKQEVLQLLEN